MPVDRGATSDERQRRTLQQLAGQTQFIIGPGLDFDEDNNQLNILLASPAGLKFNANNELLVKLDTAFGLSLATSGIRVDLLAAGGLTFSAGDLAVKLAASPGLTLSASGLRLTYGTANQVLGMNSGATAPEYKSLAVGTAGTNFAITHTAGLVTLNLPSASATARGAVTTGTQTFAGDKTFGGSVAVNGATFSAMSSTLDDLLVINSAEVDGDLTVLGSIIVGTISPSNFFSLKRRAISDVDGTVSDNDDIIIGYATLTAARVLTLSDATGTSARFLVVKDESGSCSGVNTITLTPVGGQTVNGAGTLVLSSAYAAARLYNDGANWFSW